MTCRSGSRCAKLSAVKWVALHRVRVWVLELGHAGRLAARALGLVAVLVIAPSAAQACPGAPVPYDGSDPAVRSAVWKGALSLYAKGRYDKALTQLRREGARLESQARALFQHAADGTTAPNARIQKFLEKTVYARPPALQIVADRFSFPAPVLAAWTDSACRTGDWLEARTAVRKLAILRPGPELRAVEVSVSLALDDVASLRLHLQTLLPDAFLSPLAEGRLALADGDPAGANTLFDRAALAATTPETRTLLELVRRRGTTP